MSRVNPLHSEGLTVDSVKADDNIVVYVPQTPSSSIRYCVLNEPYTDNDGDMVVDLRRQDTGEEFTLLTCEAGLTGGRYDGIWTHVAVIDED